MVLDASLVGAVIAFIVMLGGAVAWVLRRVDATDKQNGERVVAVHRRVDEAYKLMVHKDDHNQDITRIERAVSDGFREVNESLRELTRRHDATLHRKAMPASD